VLRSAAPFWSSAGARRRDAAALAAWPAWPFDVESRVPMSVAMGQLDPGAKSSCHFILIPGYFRNWYKLVKNHRKFDVYQKKVNDLSKCSVKCDLHVYVKFMHC
jgi:hypothetical protein